MGAALTLMPAERVAVGTVGRALTTSGAAHSPQNFSPGRLAAPHDGQAAASGAAHSEQNFRPGRFSVPQFEQITPRSRSA